MAFNIYQIELDLLPKALKSDTFNRYGKPDETLLPVRSLTLRLILLVLQLFLFVLRLVLLVIQLVLLVLQSVLLPHYTT